MYMMRRTKMMHRRVRKGSLLGRLSRSGNEEKDKGGIICNEEKGKE
jgi:hypothetical protein